MTFRRRIEFADTDMAGIAHFARFFVFMETAEHRFREELGFPVALEGEDGGPIGWPRVSATCDYRRPARFGDELEIRTRIVEMGRSALTFAFTFSLEGRVMAEGRLTSVCCRLEPEVRAVPIPAELAARITPSR
ncbi:MAG: thioesterase family protein [Acidobacteriota bacterium]|jgi:YbgC/YbaW family acyl-CoA thioester hydrolase